MVYPEQKNKTGWPTRVFEFVTRSRPDHPRFDVPAPIKMRLQCMKAYLEEHKTVLLKFEPNFDIFNVVGIIIDLYQCCAHQYVGTESTVNPWNFSLNTVRAQINHYYTQQLT